MDKRLVIELHQITALETQYGSLGGVCRLNRKVEY